MSTQARLRAARVVAVLFALVAGLVLMGLIDLMTLPGWVDQQYVWEVPLEASWGALFTFFLAGSYLWVALRPGSPWPAFVQLGVCALALLISAGAGQDWRPLGLSLGAAATVLVLWVLVGRPAAPSVTPPTPHWPLVVVTVLGAPLWVPYALEAFATSRTGVLGSVTQACPRGASAWLSSPTRTGPVRWEACRGVSA
jgi:hypothetical protein